MVSLIGHHQARAVVNKAQSQTVANNREEEKRNEIKADERISNSYGPPPDDSYGPPLGSSSKGPAPVYGPPELVGDHGPTPVYPPPPPDVPPPVWNGPLPSYGPPPRNVKPLKQTFAPPLSPFPAKLAYASLKLHHHGPPKQHYGPPYSSFPSSLRPPKPHYGPPFKLNTQHYGPPPVIPLSFDTTYEVLPQKVAVQFVSQPSHGQPPPPPVVPPPGVPAPPTPPDIKYDGWQPIAGSSSRQQGGASTIDEHDNNNELEGSSRVQQSGTGNGIAEGTQSVPSDSYGVPIHSPEAQDLKSSVKSGSSSSKGLPPPPLPEYEPFHNERPPHEDRRNNAAQQGQVNLRYEAATNADHHPPPLSIVGFELLPTVPSPIVLPSDPLAGPLLKLPGTEADAPRAFHNNDLSVQLSVVNAPPTSINYGPPPPLPHLAPFKPNSIESGIPLPPPPVFDSYGSPPPSSYSPNGPYPSSFSSFALHASPPPLHKHHHRPLRHPLSPPASLIPPRNREPVKFREFEPPIGLLNRYFPQPSRHSVDSVKSPLLLPSSSSSFGVDGQQLPSLHAPLAFKNTALDPPPIAAAPNARYGTPLSFGGFNTPSPVLTYGAPNFGPATSFVSTSTGFGNNLYDAVGNVAVTTTYGTPLVNLPSLSTGGGHDCGFQVESGATPLDQAFALPLLDHLPPPRSSPTGHRLALRDYQQPSSVDLKDSYGAPIATYNNAADNALSSSHSVVELADSVLSAPHDPSSSSSSSSSPSSSSSSSSSLASVTGGTRAEESVDQFLNTQEGSEALSLAAKGLAVNGGDGFEVQGSKGTYTLQIQAADGGFGAENSDGSIRHDQVLSNGLLQDILAAIEQPDQGRVVEVQGRPEAQQLQRVYNEARGGTSKDEEVGKDSKLAVERESAGNEAVALFFDNRYGDSTRKEIRSVAKRSDQSS